MGTFSRLVLADRHESNGDEVTLDASDYIAIAALAVSIVAGLANWHHTNKIFRQGSPQLEIRPTFGGNGAIFGVSIANLHTSVTASDIFVGASICMGRNFWRRLDWRAFYSRGLNPVLPLQTIEHQSEQSLADALAFHFPSIIRSEEVPPGTGNYRYSVTQAPVRWLVRVTVSYRGALLGSKRVLTKTTHFLEPELVVHSFKVRDDGQDTPGDIASVESWDMVDVWGRDSELFKKPYADIWLRPR